MFTFPQLKEHIYALSPEKSLTIGKRSEGHVSNYYFGAVLDDKEVADIQLSAEKLGVDILNTRHVTHQFFSARSYIPSE